MKPFLTAILRECSDRTRITKAVTALTGGLSCVDAVVVTAGGTGYSNSFAVTFSGGGGSGAAGTATAVAGVIQYVTITNAGSGYTSAPTPDFSAGAGSAATGVAKLAATTLDDIPTTGIDITVAPVLVPVIISGRLSFYRLESGTDAESSPWVIQPDDYHVTTNPKVWKLKQVNTGGSVIIWNPDQTLFHEVQVRGSAGAEYLAIGVGF